mmetsp:Transcript_55069/g.131932  ORF Transcript_55069/g.131932 Transcript_55069/m.131932 type:complete len:290 (-) Transcript_55069:295-1164(-)
MRLDLLCEVGAVLGLGGLVDVRARVVAQRVEARRLVVPVLAAHVVVGVHAVLSEEEGLARGVADAREEVAEGGAAVDLRRPRVEVRRVRADALDLVVQRVDVGEGRDDDDVSHLVRGHRAVVEELVQPLVHAEGGVVALRVEPGLDARVRPAAAQVVVRVVPAARVDLAVAKLLEEAVPHAVDLVADGPDQQGGVVPVLLDGGLEALDDPVPHLLRAHRRLDRLAHEEGRHQVEAVGRHRVEEGRVVLVRVPAVDAHDVRAHRLHQRQVSQPDVAVLLREVVAERVPVD